MYQYIKGKITEKGIDYLVLECAGIGYYVMASSTTLSAIRIGEEVKLFTRLIVKEDAHLLCGFAELRERDFFDALIRVSGIGQKVAMNMLSAANYGDILTWIVSGDEQALTKLPGLGKKTAQRLIVELRDQLKKNYENELPNINVAENFGPQQDIIVALSGLGFANEEINQMLTGLDLHQLSIEEAIRLALNNNK